MFSLPSLYFVLIKDQTNYEHRIRHYNRLTLAYHTGAISSVSALGTHLDIFFSLVTNRGK